MAVCSVHLCYGLPSCAVCKRPLRWFRPGLLECKCGEQLYDQSGQPVSEEDAGLFAVIRAKVLRSDVGLPNSGGLPEEQLRRMNLRSLLALVRGLGKLRTAASGGANNPEDLTL